MSGIFISLFCHPGSVIYCHCNKAPQNSVGKKQLSCHLGPCGSGMWAVLSGSSLSLLHVVLVGIQPELLVDGAAWDGRLGGLGSLSCDCSLPTASHPSGSRPPRGLSPVGERGLLYVVVVKKEREGAAGLFSSRTHSRPLLHIPLPKARIKASLDSGGGKQTPPLGGRG